jgi:hypothetical protein
VTDHADEQFLRSWLGEPVWLPESDLGHVTAYTHVTPQQRGPLPPLDRRGIIRMFAATRLVIAAVVVTLFGGLLLSVGLPSGREGDPRPAAIVPTGTPIGESSAIARPTDPAPEAVAAERSKKVHWADQGVTLDAREFVIESNGRTFRPKAPTRISGHHDTSTDDPPKRAELEAHWQDQGTFMRLGFELRSDGTDWWIDRLRAYDGTDQPEYLYYGGLEERTRTPVGQAFEGSLDARATRGQRGRLVPDARVRIMDMRLEAFDPDTIPTPAPVTALPQLVVELETSAMLPGQVQRATASWCLSGGCWPAEDIKWSTHSARTVKVAPTRGSWTQITALRHGQADVIANDLAGRNGYGKGFAVRPRPGKGTDEERYGKSRANAIYPRDHVLQVGELAVLTGWHCPEEGLRQFGPDDVPGTDDDGCQTKAISSARPLVGSGLALVGTFGPSAVVQADEFERPHDTLQYASVFLKLGDDYRIYVPNLYIRDRGYEGPALGDLDADGDVDDADREVLATALDEHGTEIGEGADGWGAELDMNGDHVIDRVDLDIVDALARVGWGELEPTPAQPSPTQPPFFPGQPPGTSPPPVTPAPEATPEP